MGKVVDGYDPLEALVAPKFLTNTTQALRYSGKTLVRAVKLTAFLLFIACLQVVAKTNAQRLSLSVKDVPLSRLFSQIEKQTSYVFFYNETILKDTKPVTLDMKDVSVEEILQASFKGQPLTFFVQDKGIFVKREEKKMAVESPVNAGVPPTLISGVVRSENGTPLAGATVYIKKLKRSKMTDASGKFTLENVPSGKYEVEISFVGYENYKTEIEVVDQEAKVVAEMKQAVNGLDETVVKGYYNTTKRLNTGDVTTVKGEDIQKQPVSDPILALEGRVPGLYIQQTTGIPGAYSTIHLRGQNSIPNSIGKLVTANDPLYIVDGVPFGSASLTNSSYGGGAVGNNTTGGVVGQGLSPFNNLNPSDIESIEVLTDADATAIYGSRGANGVILITTKKGKVGQTNVDVNVYSGIGKVTHNLKLLNTQEYLAMRHEAFANDGRSPGLTDYDVNGTWDSTRYTDWQKVLIGDVAKFTNVQASLSGGNANTQFIIGGAYSNQGTVFPGNYFDQKTSVHFNLTHSSTNERLHAQLTTSYISDKNKIPASDLTGFITLAPDAPAIYDANGNLNWQMKNGTATWNNPLANIVRQDKAITNNLISNLNIGYILLPGLELKSSFGYIHSQLNQTNLSPATYYAPPNNNNPAVRLNDFATTDVQTWIVEPQLVYHKKMGNGVLDVLTGTTFQENTSNIITQYAYGFASDALIPNPAAASTIALSGNTFTQYHYNAVFGRIGYNWEEKYLINVTGRRDGSSRFGPGKQFGNFGAAGIGWIFSKEQFAQSNLSFISFGKLRVSYGTTGNDQIKDYQYLSTYTPVASTYQGITGLNPTQLTNPYFAWERVNKLEGGVELGFIHDRIYIIANYYRNRSDNQLIGYPLPILTGFGSVQYNLPAIVQNTGLEFTLNTVNLRLKNFTWRSSINLTIPKNKLVAFSNIQNTSYNSTYTVGKSIFSKRLYHYTGVDPQAGVYTFEDVNKDGKLSSADYLPTKPITQQYYGGFLNRFTYKKIQLEIFIQFVDQLGFNYTKSFGFPGSSANQPIYVLARWQKAGDIASIEKFTQSAGAAVTAFGNATTFSDYPIGDASFIRLKNLSFSYQLSDYWQKKAHIQNARIYIQCQNLMTITKYQGMDPETGGLGLPPLRMITGGIQVIF